MIFTIHRGVSRIFERGGPISLGSIKKRSSDFKRGGSNGLMGGVQYICLIASYDRMLSKWRYINKNIWIIGRSLQGTVLNMISSVFNVVKYNSDDVL